MKHLFFFLLLFPAMLLAQEETNAYLVEAMEPNEAYIIAFSGLKLRDAPSFEAKAIAVIPFAQKIVLAQGELERLLDFNTENLVYTPDSIQGVWTKVSWKGITGYAFNAYFSWGIFKMTKDFYLLLEDAGYCWLDTYAAPNYYYYGVFLNKDSSSVDIRKIKPSFISHHGGNGGTCVHAQEKENSLFLFATREPFSEEGKVKKHYLLKDWNKNAISIRYWEPEPQLEPIRVPNSNWEISLIPSKDPLNLQAVSWALKDVLTGKKQPIPEFAEWGTHIVTIVWTGDLDRDGVTDFLVSASGADDGKYCLFLSRNPGKGKMLRLAGVYMFGDCC